MRRIAGLAAEGRIPWREDPMPSIDAIRDRLVELLQLPPAPPDCAGRSVDDGTAPDRTADISSLVGRSTSQPSAGERLHRLRLRRRECEEFDRQEAGRSLPADAEQRRRSFERNRRDLEELAQRREQLIARTTAGEGERAGLRTRHQELRRELERAQSRQGREATDRATVRTGRTAAAALDDLAVELRRRQVDVLEAETSAMYRRLTNKPELHRHVRFDRDSLRYSVLDAQERRAPFDRSTGERAVLALAVVHGLQQASGRRLPLVVEAPLKPLDPEHVRKVLTHFYAENDGQTLILVKPEEIPSGHLAAVSHRVGQRWKLSRPDADREVSVVEPVPASHGGRT